MKNVLFFCMMAVAISLFTSCKKDAILTDTQLAEAKNGGGNHQHPTPIDVSALPSTISDYINANYQGATIEKAATFADGNYAVVILVDGKPQGLLFDANGNFIKLLPAPPFNQNGGNHPHPTPIDVSALPSTISDYINANYQGATIKKAATFADGNYAVVILVDGKPQGLLFDANGNFIKLLPPPPPFNENEGNHPHPTPIDVSALPSTISDYINANYQGATIKKAATFADGNYVVVILVDGKPQRLLFDANGNFVKLLPAPPLGGHHGHGG